LWNGNPPLASLPALLARILAQAESSGPTLRRLIDAYLRDFSPTAPGINDAARRIRGALGASTQRFDAWRTVQREVRLFDPARGPQEVAQRLLADTSSEQVLA